MTIRVGVVGAAGRMGATICRAVADDPDLLLAAALDPAGAGQRVGDVAISADRRALTAEGAEVVIDFSLADASRPLLPWVAGEGMHAVVGTTGFDDADLDRFRAAFTDSNCIIASNFAISAVLMMRFAEAAAPFFDTAEIIELHHDAKVDAPSGTALSTAERMAASTTEWAADPTRHEMVPGARGGIGPGGVRMHSVRMRGMVAHQEVILGAAGQTLTLRQDSYDRTSYMPGVLLAAKRVSQHPGLTIGLDAYLDG